MGTSGRRSIHARRKAERACSPSPFVVVDRERRGFHAVEGEGWMDAFWLESVLATGQGQPIRLTTDAGKISPPQWVRLRRLGSHTLVCILAPFMARLWKDGWSEWEGRR